MPSTDQMIADLVAKGFKLPEGLGFNPVGKFWRVKGEPRTISGFETILDQHAYDLTACECARQVEAQPERDRVRLGFFWDEWQLAMRTGDTEAAIKALWEAVCGGTNES